LYRSIYWNGVIPWNYLIGGIGRFFGFKIFKMSVKCLAIHLVLVIICLPSAMVGICLFTLSIYGQQDNFPSRLTDTWNDRLKGNLT